MFDKAKFDKIADITEQLLDKYGSSKEAQDVIRDNLLILVDMMFNELWDGIKKGGYRMEYVQLADVLYKNITGKGI